MRRAFLIIAGLALLLHAPCLTWGFFMDDLGQQLALENPESSPYMSAWNLYDFGYAPQEGESWWESGALPWWMSPDWKGRFFRPLTSLTLALDQAVYGRFAPGHHLTGLLIYALLLWLVHALYREAGVPSATALFALLIFGLEDGSGLVVGWVANRNTLVEATFGVGALVCALRAGRGPPWTAWAAVALALSATLSKESGVVFLGLVGLLFLREGRRGPGALALVLAAAYPVLLFAADYGINTPFYPVPWGPPPAGSLFVSQLAFTLTGEALAAMTPFPVDMLAYDPVAKAWGSVVAGIALAVLVRWAWPVAKQVPRARFFALWFVLALLPQSMAPASDRLVFIPAIAAAPLLAQFLRVELSADTRRARSAARNLAPFAVAFLAIPASGFMLGARGLITGPLMQRFESVVLEAEVEPATADAQEWQDVVLLNVPSTLAAFGPGTVWHFRTGDTHTRFWPLQMGTRAILWERTGPGSFEIESLGQPFLGGFFENVFLSTAEPPAPGTRWRTPAFEVEALVTDTDGLRRFGVTWNGPLAEDRPRFLAWSEDRLRRIEPPAVGQTLHLEQVEPLIPGFP